MSETKVGQPNVEVKVKVGITRDGQTEAFRNTETVETFESGPLKRSKHLLNSDIWGPFVVRVEAKSKILNESGKPGQYRFVDG